LLGGFLLRSRLTPWLDAGTIRLASDTTVDRQMMPATPVCMVSGVVPHLTFQHQLVRGLPTGGMR